MYAGRKQAFIYGYKKGRLKENTSVKYSKIEFKKGQKHSSKYLTWFMAPVYAFIPHMIF